ncbi:MAG: DUF1800 domain-containing protein [Chloroflexota bacterium]
MSNEFDKRAKNKHRRDFLKGVGITAAAGAASTLAAGPVAAMAPKATEAIDSTPDYDLQATDYTPPTPSTAVIVLNKMGFGPTPGEIAAFNQRGSTNLERITSYVEEQLDHESIDDTEFETRMAEANFETLTKSRTELWLEHRRQDYNTRQQPVRELERATFLRAVYSKKQFKEFISDFWVNHFNIYGLSDGMESMIVEMVEGVIRPNMFGNFRAFLEGTARSTAMLIYLDNYKSTDAGANENYARELFELHTLGAENYFGTVSQSSVPRDENEVPLGYVDDDVYEASRAFTGWSVSYSIWLGDADDGSFVYRNDDHDRYQKRVLWYEIEPDQEAEKDGEDVLDLVAYHPGTARYICRKLVTRLIGDDAPDSVVLGAAEVFYDNRFAADQLTQVYRYILMSADFRSTWGDKVKRPFEIAVSFFRATNLNMTFRMDHGTTGNFLGYYNDTGQRLFAWGPPDGYPDFKEAWMSSAPRVYAWRMINYMISRDTDNEDAAITTSDIANDYYIDILGPTPSDKRTAEELADYWIERILGRTMDSADRQEVVDFMGNGFNPDYELPLDDDQSTQERLRMMVALICCAPDFYWK